MKLRTPPVVLAACLFILTLPDLGRGAELVSEGTWVPDAKERAVIVQATESLQKDGNDFAALETLLELFATKASKAQLVGGDAFINGPSYAVFDYKDKALSDANDALKDWYSIDLIERAMKDGSERAVQWALAKLDSQAMNSPSCDKIMERYFDKYTPSFRRLTARSGVVTVDAWNRLTPCLEQAIASKRPSINNLYNAEWGWYTPVA